MISWISRRPGVFAVELPDGMWHKHSEGQPTVPRSS